MAKQRQHDAHWTVPSSKNNQGLVRLLEAWRNRPLVTSQVAAFHAGRHWNGLRFHLAQAFVLHGVKMYAEARARLESAVATIEEMIAILPAINSASAWDTEPALQGARDEFVSSFDDDRHRGYLVDREWADWDEKGLWLRTSWHDDLIARFVTPVVDRVRQVIWPVLSDGERRAFSLGDWLDAGVRPVDVHRRMFGKRRWSREQRRQLSALEKSQNLFQLTARGEIVAVPPITGSRLANCTRHAGALAPPNNWKTILELLVHRMLRETIDSPPANGGLRDQRERAAYVDAMDKAIRERFRQLEGEAIAERVLFVNRETNTVVFRGIPYGLKNDQSTLYIQALIDGKGLWVTAKDINSKYPAFEGAKIHRIRAALPKPIRELIITTPGKGSRIPLEKLA